jgi:hypothetical protein
MTDVTPEVILGSDLTIDFCKIDPALFDLMSGARATVDCDGAIAGTAQGTATAVGSFALEIWAKRGPSGDLSTAASGAGWYYTVFPNVKKGALGGTLTWEDGPQTYTLTASAAAAANWNVGPYGVIPAVGAPSTMLDAPAAPDFAPTAVAVALCDAVRDDEFVYSISTTVKPPAPMAVSTAGSAAPLPTDDSVLVSDADAGFAVVGPGGGPGGPSDYATLGLLKADVTDGDGAYAGHTFVSKEAVVLGDNSKAYYDKATSAWVGTAMP